MGEEDGRLKPAPFAGYEIVDRKGGGESRLEQAEARGADGARFGTASRAQISAVRDVVLAQANLGLSGATRKIKLKPSRKLLGRGSKAKLRLVVRRAGGLQL